MVTRIRVAGRRQECRARRQAHSPTRLIMAALGVIVALVAASSTLWWHLEGGRWYAVSSPSMGQALPTGSFLVTEPTSLSKVETGDIITFTSPSTGKVFTHRIVKRSEAGVTTRGDVNSADDAWVVTDDNLIGQVVWHVPILGWAGRAVPLLGLGGTITWLAPRLLRVRRRTEFRLLGACLTVAATSWWLNPWVDLVQISQTTPNDGSTGVVVEVVSAGLLPIKVFEKHESAGSGIALVNGQVGNVHLTDLTNGRFQLTSHLDLPWWGWAIMLVALLSPVLWIAALGVSSKDEEAQLDTIVSRL